jgi:hypothetical protein
MMHNYNHYIENNSFYLLIMTTYIFE